MEFKDVYQEKELGQLVQRYFEVQRCTESINSRLNTLKFRGALKVLTPELILLHLECTAGINSRVNTF